MKQFGILLCAANLLAASSATVAPPAPVRFAQTRLNNGLRIIVSEDHFAPTFSIAVIYGSGSNREQRGKTGVSHLLEHLMFDGSPNVGPGEHQQLMLFHSSAYAATTGIQSSTFSATYPKHQLEMALFLEADRMRSLNFAKENLEVRKASIRRELQRAARQPYALGREQVVELAYGSFEFGHSIMGSLEDLNGLTPETVERFCRTHFAPANAVLAVVGDVSRQAVIDAARRWFGSIQSVEAPQPVRAVVDPNRTRRVRVEDQFAVDPRVDAAFHLDNVNPADLAGLRLLSIIFAEGDRSRLHARLVNEKWPTHSTVVRFDHRYGPGVYRLAFILNRGEDPERGESALLDEITKLHNEPVSNAELELAKRTATQQQGALYDVTVTRARALAECALLYDQPDLVNTIYKLQMAATAQDLQRVARRYLNRANGAIVLTPTAQKNASNRPTDVETLR